MSDNTKPLLIEGPDGRLYEIPNDRLAEFAVPGERVAELRKQQAAAHAPPSASAPTTSAPAADQLPPGHMRPQDVQGNGHSMTINPPNGGSVTLNFFFGGAAPTSQAHPGSDVDGYHMSLENGFPVNHTEVLWGDYVDKQGNPAVGFHSHDPVTGNAQ